MASVKARLEAHVELLYIHSSRVWMNTQIIPSYMESYITTCRSHAGARDPAQPGAACCGPSSDEIGLPWPIYFYIV